MSLYGEALYKLGIGIIIVTLIIAAVFFAIYIISGKQLEKKLMNEYGEKKARRYD